MWQEIVLAFMPDKLNQVAEEFLKRKKGELNDVNTTNYQPNR